MESQPRNPEFRNHPEIFTHAYSNSESPCCNNDSHQVQKKNPTYVWFGEFQDNCHGHDLVFLSKSESPDCPPLIFRKVAVQSNIWF